LASTGLLEIRSYRPCGVNQLICEPPDDRIIH